MRSLPVAIGILGVVRAQDLSSLPQCAQSCALSAIGSTGCAATDAHCICSAASFLSGVESCISTACSAADQAAAIAFAQQYCLTGSVTITLPSSTASTSAPATAAPSSSSAAPVPADTTTTATVGPSPSASSESSSAVPATFSGAAAAIGCEWVIGMLGVGAGVMAAW